MDDDYTLLQQFVRERSDAAFETLMRRHADLVYSSALRQTADAHLADDVTQAVFVILARKAATLDSRTVLPAWLLTVTHFTACNAGREKSARQRIEHKAAIMNPAHAAITSPDPDWPRVAPLLDDALAELNEADRAAVVLRYFQHGTSQDVAARLGLSLDAAEKRLARAVEKLKRIVARKGVMLPALALAALLSRHAVHAAPAKLLAALPAAVASAHAGVLITASVTLANGGLHAMTLATTKQLALCAAVFLLVGIAGGLAFRFYSLPAQTPAAASTFADGAGDSPAPRTQVPAPANDPVQVPVAQIPIAPVAPVPPAALEAPVGASVDLLSHLDLAADLVNGQWSVENGEILTDTTVFGRVQLPYIPPEEYDFNLDFTILKPCGDIALICSKNGRQFVWKMGAHGNKVDGFEAIAGITNNVANPTFRYYEAVFSPNQHCKVTVQVRNSFIAAYVDGELISRHATQNCADMSLFGYWSLDAAENIGVGTWATPARIHAISVVEVTGKGRMTRPDGEKPVARPRPVLTGAERWKDAVDLMPLIDPERDAVNGRWAIANGVAGPELTCAESPFARLIVPCRPPEEYDFKVVFTRQTGHEQIVQFMGDRSRSFQWILGDRSGWSCAFQRFTRNFEGDNPTTVIGTMAVNNKIKITSIVQVRKTGFSAFVDDKLISHWPATTDGFLGLNKAWSLPEAGLLGVGANNSTTTFHSIQLLEFTGKCAPVDVKAPRRIPEPAPDPQLPAEKVPLKPPGDNF